MKRSYKLLAIMLLVVMGFGMASCKKEVITLSSYELWFPGDVGSAQDIVVTSNCGWTISIDDGADWYTVRRTYDKTVMTENGPTTITIIDTTQVVTSGEGNMTLAILAQPMAERSGRTSTFTITSQKGKVQARVTVSQSTDAPVELTDIRNMAFGVSNVAHWNVDFFGEVIEDSYIHKEFNPYDTAVGFIMYFFDDGTGVQKDNVNGVDSAYYWAFDYEYDPVARNLHLEFETYSDTVSEIYDAPVLIATENVFRFMHEYKAHSWERADMKKIGEAHKPEAKEALKRKAVKKRSGGQGIFQF